MNAAGTPAGWAARFAALFVLSVACVIAGGAMVGGALPADAASEPGLVSPAAGLLVLSLIVGLLFSLPQNVGLLMENPLIPSASVRLSHLVETASSTFLFGAIVVWLLHREHHSPGDLLGLRRSSRHFAPAPAAHPRPAAENGTRDRTRFQNVQGLEARRYARHHA
jgi:hypothetical protein